MSVKDWWRRMKEEIHVHIHLPEAMDRKLDILIRQGEHIMGALDDLRAQTAAGFAKVGENGAKLSEVASDLDDLIAKLAAGTPGSQEVIDATAEATALTAALTAQGEALTALAAKHTP